MTANTEVALSWLAGLAARGLTATVRRGRLYLHPAKPNPFTRLTDDETLTLRHHKADIIDALNAGISFDVRAALHAVSETPPPAPPSCSWCYRAPCIGVDHPAFYALHPVERQRRDDERLTAEMLACLGRPHRLWDGLL